MHVFYAQVRNRSMNVVTRETILIACEFSGIVRNEFYNAGHKVVSCDLMPTESTGLHIQGELADLMKYQWKAVIGFPPYRYLSVSGARWWKERRKEQNEALAFVQSIMDANSEFIAVENPVGRISTAIRKPEQTVQPYEFGHGEVKRTCFWLKGLPKLVPTDIVDGRKPRVLNESPGPDRWKRRSRTYSGIAKAMANQWGKVIDEFCIYCWNCTWFHGDNCINCHRCVSHCYCEGNPVEADIVEAEWIKV